METESTNENDASTPTDATKMETNETEGENKPAEGETKPAAAPQPKAVVKSVDLQCDNKTSGINQQLLLDLTEREVNTYLQHIIRVFFY